MFFTRKKQPATQKKLKGYISNETFQKMFFTVSTLLIAFIIVLNGAAPVKYKLSVGSKAPKDIFAPRDIENTLATEANAKAVSSQVPDATREITAAPIEVLNNAENFFSIIEDARLGVEKKLVEQGVSKNSPNYTAKLLLEQGTAADSVLVLLSQLDIQLSIDQVRYLIVKTSDNDLNNFKKLTRDLISTAMKNDITSSTLNNKVTEIQTKYQISALPRDLKIIGEMLVKSILKPNEEVDEELTKRNREKAYVDALKNDKVIIDKNSRIIGKGEVVSEDKLEVLKELKMIETKNLIDIPLAVSILIVLLLLSSFLFVYVRFFCKHILKSRNEVLLLCLVIILTLVISRVCYEYTPLAIPIFIAPMLISILLDIGLAGIVSSILAIAVSFITKGDLTFLYMSLIGGVFSAFLVSKATQRSRLSIAGSVVGVVNVLIVISLGMISNKGLSGIAWESMIVFFNGIISVIFTIGMLPIWESTFNIITPLKLLELTDPNQPLIKRLLLEAPGTYHHSLMVGNLAEVACEDIGGNPLLARVGAYFHDVGKLKRPNFFKENQLGDNPHDKMTPNLSTLVITSHTQDGVELALKNKIPLAIRDIIQQHHGTTLVAFFYHKAKKSEKGEAVKPENFRYEGPKPETKEAAVVMLADSVEAAVRSMVDKTEGKIEGLIRKIIKDKLDDGQLDLCDLTLKDLDGIAKAFMRVMSGLFHERQEYPDIRAISDVTDETGIPGVEYIEKTTGDKSSQENDISAGSSAISSNNNASSIDKCNSNSSC